MNTNKVLCLAVMCIWSGSLMQFVIIIPASKVSFESLENTPNPNLRAKLSMSTLLDVIKPRRFVAIWMFGGFWSMSSYRFVIYNFTLVVYESVLTGCSILCIPFDVDHLLQADLLNEPVLHCQEHPSYHTAGAPINLETIITYSHFQIYRLVVVQMEAAEAAAKEAENAKITKKKSGNKRGGRRGGRTRRE